MSRQENRNRGEKQQKKNGNKHALTSLAPPTEQIALPAVNFVKYTCCSHSILLSCCFFSRKMSQKRLRFTAEQVLDAVRALHCIPQEFREVLLEILEFPNRRCGGD